MGIWSRIKGYSGRMMVLNWDKEISENPSSEFVSVIFVFVFPDLDKPY